MSSALGLMQRLQHLADVVMREAAHLAQTDLRLFGPGFGLEEAASLQSDVDPVAAASAMAARVQRLVAERPIPSPR